MEALIKSIKEITLDKLTVDDLIDKLNNFTVLGKRKCELEYQDFRINYKKLEEIKNFLIELSPNEQNNLRIPIEEFLIVIDKKTQYYIQEINWNPVDEDIMYESQKISDFFFKSLNSNNQIEKINYILEAYSLISDIIDDLGNER
jgi:hypothetical protein